MFTIRYNSVYLTWSKKLTGSQLSLPHGTRFCCSWTTYLKQFTCQFARQGSQLHRIQKTTENIHVSDGLRWIVTFLTIASYKYCYLLTYLQHKYVRYSYSEMNQNASNVTISALIKFLTSKWLFLIAKRWIDQRAVLDAATDKNLSRKQTTTTRAKVLRSRLS